MRDRPGIDLAAILEARSIAVVGASANSMRPGARCLANLAKFGFPGAIYPVNARHAQINGLACYPSLRSIPEPVDLVIVASAASTVAPIVSEAAECGVRGMVIFSSGYVETGDEGRQRQTELSAAAAQAGIAVLGPNTAGLADLGTGVVATFTSALDEDLDFRPGPVAIVSQSGAVSAALFARVQQEGGGCGAFVGTGNEAVVDVADFIDYFAERGDIRAIVGYLEGVRDGKRLIDACSRARANDKLVALLKVGDTGVGRRMAQSHTGALAADRDVFDAAMRDAGVIVVSDLNGLVDLALGATAHYSPAGPRVGIVSMSGGAAVMMSDRCDQLGLEIVEFTKKTCSDLDQVLPSYTSRSNPVDYGGLAGDPDKIVACIDTVARDPGVDQVLLSIGTSPFLHNWIEEHLQQIRADSGKPIVTGWIGGPRGAVAGLRQHDLPAYDDPYRAVAYVAALANRPLVESAVDPVSAHSTNWSAPPPADLTRSLYALLDAYSIPHGPMTIAPTAAAALEWSGTHSGPFAVKAEAPGLLHKTEVGAVQLSVERDDVVAAYERVVSAARSHGFEPIGALIQTMAMPGIEVIVGIHRDPSFGPVIVIGMGGVNAELLRDTVIAFPGIDGESASERIRSLRGYPLLAGYRGSSASDLAALTGLVVQVGRLAADHGGEIDELDLNPVVVHPDGWGCTVVDVGAVLAGSRSGSPS